VGAPAARSTATTPSSEALWASALTLTRSPIAKTCGLLDVLLFESPLDDPRHVLVLGRKDLVEHLDQQHLGAEAPVGGGDLAARGAGADHGDLLRLLGQRPGAPGVEDAAAELDPGDRQGDRAGGEHHRSRLVDLPADLDVGLGGERPLALDRRHLVLVPEHLHAVRQRFGDGGAALAQRVPVDRGVLHLQA
jgi:hypothetical protein